MPSWLQLVLPSFPTSMSNPLTSSSASSLTLFLDLSQFSSVQSKIPIAPAKGHLQPHVSNLPRRPKRPIKRPVKQDSDSSDSDAVPDNIKRRRSGQRQFGRDEPANLPNGVQTSAQHESPAASRLWDSCTQEILPKSNIYLSFLEDPADFHPSSCDGYSLTVTVLSRTSTDTGINSDYEEQDGQVVVFVPEDKLHDHGLPHLSAEQLVAVWRRLAQMKGDRDSQRIMIRTSVDRAVDAVAISVGYLAVLQVNYHARPARPIAQRCLTACNWSHDGPETWPIEQIPSNEGCGPVHGILTHIHDYHEDSFHDAWKGVLSSDGVELLEAAIRELSSLPGDLYDVLKRSL